MTTDNPMAILYDNADIFTFPIIALVTNPPGRLNYLFFGGVCNLFVDFTDTVESTGQCTAPAIISDLINCFGKPNDVVIRQCRLQEQRGSFVHLIFTVF
jgi:hypothetical protein